MSKRIYPMFFKTGAFLTAFFLVIIAVKLSVNIFALAPEEKQPPSTQSRTLQFFILQRTADLTAGAQVDQSFSVFIGESTPVVKSVFIELRGVRASPGASPSITVSVDDTALTTRAVTFALDTSTTVKPFRFLYDSTNYIGGQISGPGTKTFTLSVKANDITLSVLSAKITLTYQFAPPTEGPGGGFRAKAEVISSAFDTAVTNGAAPNTIMYKTPAGTIPAGTKVRFQFATSNAVSGPYTFVGPDNTGATYYEPSGPDVPIEIKKEHHNLRYFKYKIQLCSNTDCATAGGASTPEVTDVVLNWSP